MAVCAFCQSPEARPLLPPRNPEAGVCRHCAVQCVQVWVDSTDSLLEALARAQKRSVVDAAAEVLRERTVPPVRKKP
jgi:NMD protein affecting ribosome stability and mRNA decay